MDPRQLSAIDTERFKKRADLVTYSLKRPGALAAHFLSAVRAKCSKRPVEQTRDLATASVADYVTLGHTGLTEIRDIREAQTVVAGHPNLVCRRAVAMHLKWMFLRCGPIWCGS